MSTVTWIILAAIALVVFWLVGVYNSLIRKRNQTNEAWADIDVQLKRRYDLIPNLMETVKGYAAHEKEVFYKVTEARSKAMGAQGAGEKGQAENMLSGALKSLFALAENYPQLKANENFAKLQDELSDTENKIQAARRFYNGNVRDFNTAMQVFPNSLIAGMMGFKPFEFFELEEAEGAAREPVKVKF